jgi:hypothetical protein
MKNTMRLSPWLLALNLAVGLLLVPAHAAHAQAVVGDEAGNGSVELGNTLGTDEPAPLKVEPGTAPAPQSTELATAEAEPAKDPRELHRDLLLQTPEEMPVATSAASRRYRQVDLSALRARLQGSAIAPAR